MDGYENFPLTTRRIYNKTLKALNQNAFILSAIGLRAIIESICVEQKITATTDDQPRGHNLNYNGSLNVHQWLGHGKSTVQI